MQRRFRGTCAYDRIPWNLGTHACLTVLSSLATERYCYVLFCVPWSSNPMVWKTRRRILQWCIFLRV